MAKRIAVLYLAVALLVAFVSKASGATWAKLIADSNGRCEDEEEGVSLALGEEMQDPNWCGAVTCSQYSDEQLMLQGATCGVVTLYDGLPEGKCLVDANPDADYPECCEKKIGDC